MNMKWSLIYSYQVEHSNGLRTFAESVEQIQLAEKLGCDTAMVSEHHLVDNGYFPAPFVTLAAIAAQTKTIRLGPGIVILPLYDPLHVAEHGAVLDIISGGRFIMGVGQGYRPEEFDAFRVPLTARPGRMREGCDLIRALWTQEAVDFEGRHFNLRDVRLQPKPTQKPHPPIWVAAKKKSAVELAAEVGDTWFADPVTPFAVLKQRLHDYRTRLASCGRPIPAEFPMMREAYCAESDELAWEEAREPILSLYREYLEWGHMQDEQGNPVRPDSEDALAALRKRFIVGSPQTCVDECLRYKEELGVNNLVLRMKAPGLPHQRVLNSIRLWAEKVSPHI